MKPVLNIKSEPADPANFAVDLVCKDPRATSYSTVRMHYILQNVQLSLVLYVEFILLSLSVLSTL